MITVPAGYVTRERDAANFLLGPIGDIEAIEYSLVIGIAAVRENPDPYFRHVPQPVFKLFGVIDVSLR